jgi:hypothetical protein
MVPRLRAPRSEISPPPLFDTVTAWELGSLPPSSAKKAALVDDNTRTGAAGEGATVKETVMEALPPAVLFTGTVAR